MPWDDTARAEHTRETGRYPTDLTDAEWEIIKPLLPPAKTGGRPRTTKLREVFNAIQYMAGSGCQWRMLPSDLPAGVDCSGLFLLLDLHGSAGNHQLPSGSQYP